MEEKDSGEWEGWDGDVGGVDRVWVRSLEESEEDAWRYVAKRLCSSSDGEGGSEWELFTMCSSSSAKRTVLGIVEGEGGEERGRWG